MTSRRLLLIASLSFAHEFPPALAANSPLRLSHPMLLNGSVTAVDGQILSVGLQTGDVQTINLADGWSIVVGYPVSRRDLNVGDVVGIPALVVRLPGQTFLVAHWFATAGPELSVFKKKELVTRFLPPRGQGVRSSDLDSEPVAGRFVGSQRDSILNVSQSASIVSVKLDPEAVGYRLQSGAQADIAVGSNIILVERPSRPKSLLVFKGENPR